MSWPQQDLLHINIVARINFSTILRFPLLMIAYVGKAVTRAH